MIICSRATYWDRTLVADSINRGATLCAHQPTILSLPNSLTMESGQNVCFVIDRRLYARFCALDVVLSVLQCIRISDGFIVRATHSLNLMNEYGLNADTILFLVAVLC